MLLVQLSPRALRDLKRFPSYDASMVLKDLELLRVLPWPSPPKVKHLHGTPYARLRTGDFRSIIEREGQKVVVLRVVARKDLERVLRNL